MAYLCSFNSVDALCSSACSSAGNNQSACLNSCHSQMTPEKILSQCPVYVPSVPDTVFVSADTVFVSADSCYGNLPLSPSVVDSVMSAFSQGFQGGLLTFLPGVACAVAVLVVVHLLSYSISKS